MELCCGEHVRVYASEDKCTGEVSIVTSARNAQIVCAFCVPQSTPFCCGCRGLVMYDETLHMGRVTTSIIFVMLFCVRPVTLCPEAHAFDALRERMLLTLGEVYCLLAVGDTLLKQPINMLILM